MQEKAWIDEQLVHYWIDNILGTDITTSPCGIIPIVILDSYKAHFMHSVVNRIKDLRAKVWYIPGGCTSLCQPVGIGFNKPLKDHICAQWEEWIIHKGLVSKKPLTHEQDIDWTVNAYNSIPNEIVRNAWRHVFGQLMLDNGIVEFLLWR